jgi:surface polysaccharide O-acyltransferase-like enzyme
MPATPVTAWKNIGVMRGIGIAMVVLNHASMGAFGVLRASPVQQPVSSLAVLVELLVKGLTPACLPVFLFASGYFTGRFSSTWKAASSNAWRIVQGYCLWSIPSFAILVALGDRVVDRDVVRSFVVGGPWPSYWFLILLVQLSLVAPVIARGITAWPRAAVAVVIVVQCGATAAGYAAAAGAPVVPNHAVVMHLHFFAGGMIFSSRASSLVPFIIAHRAAIAVIVCVLAGVSCAESVWLGHVLGDGSPASWVYGGERLSLQSFAVAFIAWLVTLPSSTMTRWRTSLDWIGLRSLAVLLMMDPCVSWSTRIMWHFEDIMFGSQRSVSLPPEWMMSVGLLPVLFVVGLGVPIATFQLVELGFGKRVRAFLFS